MLKMNFASTATKTNQEYFKVKGMPISHFNLFINYTLEGSQTAKKILISPRKKVKGDTVDLKLSQTSFVYK